MLYNILPPIIFFMSLGGVIVVVSRVVLRIRREQISEQIKNEAAESAPVKHETLLRPAQKKVSAIKDRLGLMTYYIKNTGQYMKKTTAYSKQSWQQWREKRAEAKELKKAAAKAKADSPDETREEKSGDQAKTEGEQTSGIKLPTSNWRNKVGTYYASSVDVSRQAVTNLKTTVKTKLEERAARREQLKANRQSLQEEADITASQETGDEPKIKITRIENSKTGLLKSAIKKEALKKGKQAKAPDKKTGAGSRLMSSFLKTEEKKPPTTTVEIAKEALKSGQYQRVEDLIVPHLIKNTKDTSAYMVLGKAALARQSWDESIEIFEQVIKIKPDQKGAYASLGYAAYKAGRFTRALQALQRAHDNDPSNVKVLHSLLKITERMDNKVLKRSVLEDLIVLEPDKKEYKKKLEDMQEKQKMRA